MIDIHNTLQSLAAYRPIFHSEADFQYALAWHIHQQRPELKVRLEFRPAIIQPKMYVDIWLECDGAVVAIELKYKTRKTKAVVSGEPFDLLNHGAHDISRYDFCKDIARTEALAAARSRLTGVAILLTNDPGYWQAGRGGTVDCSFRIHDGATLRGTLAWDPRASDGTTRGRADSLGLAGTYSAQWQDYSDLEGVSAGRFRSLVFSTPPSA